MAYISQQTFKHCWHFTWHTFLDWLSRIADILRVIIYFYASTDFQELSTSNVSYTSVSWLTFKNCWHFTCHRLLSLLTFKNARSFTYNIFLFLGWLSRISYILHVIHFCLLLMRCVSCTSVLGQSFTDAKHYQWVCFMHICFGTVFYWRQALPMGLFHAHLFWDSLLLTPSITNGFVSCTSFGQSFTDAKHRQWAAMEWI